MVIPVQILKKDFTSLFEPSITNIIKRSSFLECVFGVISRTSEPISKNISGQRRVIFSCKIIFTDKKIKVSTYVCDSLNM